MKNKISYNEITIDVERRMVYVLGIPVNLTRMEFELLLLLISHANLIISKNGIAEKLLGKTEKAFESFDLVYTHLKNLKRKLSAAGCTNYIFARYGMGYVFRT